MNGRIVRPENVENVLGLPIVGKLHIGLKAKNQYGKEYPTSVDYFIPKGKYAGLFTERLGEKPNSIVVLFPTDDAEKVCNERYEYRDDKGDLVAYGDGSTFRIWNGKEYAPYSVDKIPDIMQQVCERQPNSRVKNGNDGWDISLTMRFVVWECRKVIGVWELSTKGAASSIRNIRDSFDAVKTMRGTVTGTAFDLSVKFAKSNKPGVTSKFPVLELVANDMHVDEIRTALADTRNVNLMLPDKKE